MAQQWSCVGDTLNSAPTKLFYDSINDRLITAGVFSKIGDEWITGIASWNGTTWDSIGHGIDFYDTIGNNTAGNVHALCYFNNQLYCGGSFQKAGFVLTNGLARWNGIVWDSVPGGDIPDFCVVHDMDVYNNELYICGSFDSVGAIPADGIAKWNGSTWAAVGGNYPFSAPSGIVTRLKFYHGDLFVSGNFLDSAGNTCRLAKWNGNGWQFLNSVVQGGISSVWDIEVYNDELYVSGLFYASQGSVATGIVRWNDTIWRDVGGSVEIGTNAFPTITDMEVYAGKLYCGGNFNIVGGISAEHFASWDGTNWCGYQTTFDNKITQLAFYDDTLYVSGGFQIINGDTLPWMAKWIGGSFVDTCGNTTGIDEPEPVQGVLVYPNPASETVIFQFDGSVQARLIIIFDARGREVWSQNTSDLNVVLPAAEFSNGIYFYAVTDSELQLTTGKFIVAH